MKEEMNEERKKERKKGGKHERQEMYDMKGVITRIKYQVC